jgi:antiviral helicase SKI2
MCHFGFAETAYRWACGETFNDIMATSHMQEGTIVRVMVRLEELLRKVRVAARLMHNQSLMDRIDKAGELIKRDVVFAASLYVE